VIGEVRYDNPEHAQHAMSLLNGSTVGGAVIEVKQDMTSKDGTKLLVTGLPVGLDWQELKDHFGCVGTVAFCDVKQVGAKGKGKSVADDLDDVAKIWAYMDPKGDLQVGFSMKEMRQWYDLGYFEADMQVALVEDPGDGTKPKTPTRREFFALQKWFPQASRAFTFLPKF